MPPERITIRDQLRVGDLQAGEHGHRLGPRLATRRALVDLEDFGDLEADGERRVQGGRGILVDHRDSSSPERPPLNPRHPQQVVTVEEDPARRDRAIPLQVPHDGECERALPAPRLSHHAVCLVSPQAEIEVTDRAQAAGPRRIGDLEPLDPQDLIHR